MAFVNTTINDFIDKIITYNNVDEILNQCKTQSDKGFVFERLWDIVIKFGFCELFPNSKYGHLYGNVNNGKLKKFKSFNKYLQENVYSGNSGGCSDITLKNKLNGRYIFISSKYPKENNEKSVNYYDVQNDSLSYKFSTNDISDYGNLKVTLENVKRFPVIVQLLDEKEAVMASEYSDKNTVLNFELLEPRKYTLRLIYDDNKDNEWTPGNFLALRQSEEVIYFPKELDVRANWDVEQPFDLSK